ncbi:MAG: hypothetical protein ACRC35_08305, partial [Angustibacter sp.]
MGEVTVDRWALARRMVAGVVALAVVGAGVALSPVASATGSGGSATLAVGNWQADTSSGLVTYSVSASGEGTCSSGCSVGIQAGRSDASGNYMVVATLPTTQVQQSVSGGTWTGRAEGAAVRSQLPEVTAVRAVYTDSSGQYPAAWQVVSPPYPDASLSLSKTRWDADPATGKISYDVTVTGGGLAKSGGTCENRWCYPSVQTGRVNPDGTITQVGTLSGCTGDTSSNNRWTITMRCATDNQTNPEITRIRAVLDGSGR